MRPRLPEAVRTQAALVRFLVVGGLCFTSSMVALAVLTEVLGWHHLVSAALVMLGTNVAGWLFNRSWTFAVRRRRTVAEFTRYAFVNALAMFISLVLVGGLTAIGLHYLAACALVALTMSVVNFHAHSRWSLRLENDSAQ